MRACFVLFLLVTMGACSDDSSSSTNNNNNTSCQMSALLPPDSAVLDFTQAAAPQIAATEKELTDLIDGGSEKYTQNKFRCLALVTYKSASKTHTLEARVFDQTDTAGADAAWEATKHPDNIDLSPTIGEASREMTNTIAGVYIAEMKKGEVLSVVTADELGGKDDAIALLKAIANLKTP